MKTNIQALMNKIAEEEKALLDITTSMKGHVINTTIEELDGKKNVTEDYKKEYKDEEIKLEELIKEIINLKKTLHQKNNEFTLKDGRTIQEAIVENTYLRRLKQVYESFSNYKSKKSRISEYHDAYFECREINFDKEKVKDRIKELERKIEETDFEITKCNSLEFEI